MLKFTVVLPLNSPWLGPVLIVQKANGEPHICFDSRNLNSVIKKITSPLPIVNHIFNKLSGANDLNNINVYNQDG